MSLMGIICASDTERDPFLKWMKQVSKTKAAVLEFYQGTLSGVPVVVVYSGVCKVSAAIAAQLLITMFHVDGIINSGTAGGMDEKVRLFDTVVGEYVAYHNVADDGLTEFHPWLAPVYFRVDSRLVDLAREVGRTAHYPVLCGKIVTGESFIEENRRKKPRPLLYARGRGCLSIGKRHQGKKRVETFQGQLAWGGSLGGGAKSDGRAEKAAADPGDHPQIAHTHRDEGRSGVPGEHLLRGLQQSQHVVAAAGHDGDFQEICAQFLHAAQAAHQLVLGRRFFKIVAGEHNAYAGAVGSGN